MTLIFEHAICLEHDLGQGHPERPDRLRAIQLALAEPAFAALERRSAPLASWPPQHPYRAGCNWIPIPL